MKNILIYGDSNTWGYVPGGDGQRYGLDERWPGVLRHEIGEGFHIIEEGLCGRTTASDDWIEGEGRNGSTMIKPILMSHSPLDLVIIMLGTNDLKNRFGKSCLDIALGVASLVNLTRNLANGCSSSNFFGPTPEILVLIPPPILERGPFKDAFIGGSEKSENLAQAFAFVGEQFSFDFFDTRGLIESSEVDGIHLDKLQHLKLGRAVADLVKKKFVKD